MKLPRLVSRGTRYGVTRTHVRRAFETLVRLRRLPLEAAAQTLAAKGETFVIETVLVRLVQILADFN